MRHIPSGAKSTMRIPLCVLAALRAVVGFFTPAQAQNLPVVYAWGDNSDGQLGNNSTIMNSSSPVQVVGVGGAGLLSNIGAVAGGGNFSLALSCIRYGLCVGIRR